MPRVLIPDEIVGKPLGICSFEYCYFSHILIINTVFKRNHDAPHDLGANGRAVLQELRACVEVGLVRNSAALWFGLLLATPAHAQTRANGQLPRGRSARTLWSLAGELKRGAQARLSSLAWSSCLAQQGLGKFLGVEGFKVLHSLAYADEIHRYHRLACCRSALAPQGNGGQHAAFGRSVELGDDQAG